MTSRAFTLRSLLFSLVGVGLVAGLSGFHDERMPNNVLMVGNHLPVTPFVYLFFVGVVWNGLVGRLGWKRLALSPRELTVVMVACFVACFAPTSGLFRYFHRGIMMPWRVLASGAKPDWARYGLLETLLPSKLFPSPAPYRDAAGVLRLDETVYRGFFLGLSGANDLLPLSAIPFRAWAGMMSYWGPLLLLCAVASTSLAFLVHRQWSRHEQLSYPIAQVAGSYCHREDGGRGVPDLFRNPLFWFGFAPMFLLYTMEYVGYWFPDTLPRMGVIVPALKGWGIPLNQKFPILAKTPVHSALNWQTIYFCVVGLGYFVSSEVGLTMGLAPLLLTLFGLWYYGTTGQPLAQDQLALGRGGAFVGFALVLLYTGRAYYGALFLRAFGWRRHTTAASGGAALPDAVADDVGVLAARVLVLAAAGFVAVLATMGCALSMAVLYTLLLLLLFLVLSRIVCETGIPFVAAEWWPGKLLVSLLGPAAVGPGSLVLLLWVSNALCADPRECLMPFVATGNRLADDAGIRLRKVFAFVVGVIVVAVAVAFVSKHWTLYNLGPMADPQAAETYAQMPFNDAARYLGELANLGTLEKSAAATGLGRFRLFSPVAGAWTWVLGSAGAVLLVSALRFRFASFPLHPVLFLVWGTFPSTRLWASFLLGWAIKGLVIRFGGGSVYVRLKPVFIGLISSELIASGLIVIVDMLYYWTTGVAPTVTFRILLTG
jgi:hypothetical protein